MANVTINFSTNKDEPVPLAADVRKRVAEAFPEYEMWWATFTIQVTDLA